MIADIVSWEQGTVVTMNMGTTYLYADMEIPAVHIRIFRVH